MSPPKQCRSITSIHAVDRGLHVLDLRTTVDKAEWILLLVKMPHLQYLSVELVICESRYRAANIRAEERDELLPITIS